MRHPVLALAAVAAALAIGAAVVAAPVTVTCPPEPAQGVQESSLRTIWEVPGETEDYLFGRLMDARLDRDGNVCLVDFQLKNLKIFAPDGTWLRTLGREGEGPGECRDARRLFLRADGAYGILQGVPGAIVWLRPDGTPDRTTRVGGEVADDEGFLAVGWAIQAGGDAIYAWTNRFIEREGAQQMQERVVRLAPDGRLGPTLYEPPAMADAVQDDVLHEERLHNIWEMRWCPGADGSLWVAPERDRYLLQNWADGELRREVLRPGYRSLERTEAEREAVAERLGGQGWSEDRLRVGKTAPVVRRLRLGDGGDLWALLDQGGHAPRGGFLAVFDVFSPAGEWLRQVRWRADVALASWVVLDDTRLVGVREGPEGESGTLVLLGTAEAAD